MASYDTSYDTRIYRLFRTPLEFLSRDDMRDLLCEIERAYEDRRSGQVIRPELGACVFHEPGDPRLPLLWMPRDPRLQRILLEPDIAQE